MIKYFCDRCKSECDDHYLKLDIEVTTKAAPEQTIEPIVLCPGCFSQSLHFLHGNDINSQMRPIRFA